MAMLSTGTTLNAAAALKASDGHHAAPARLPGDAVHLRDAARGVHDPVRAVHPARLDRAVERRDGESERVHDHSPGVPLGELRAGLHHRSTDGKFLMNSVIIARSPPSVRCCRAHWSAMRSPDARAGQERVFMIVLATMMIPAQITMIPQFILFKELGG